MKEKKQSIRELDYNELVILVEKLGKRKFVAKDLMHWLYKKQVHSFDEMTSLSKQLIADLKKDFIIDSLSLKSVQKSKEDGTIKFLFSLEDNNTVETVFIPKGSRYTICVSCQVGCKMDCKFCKTGSMGFIRDLKASEIVEQIVYVNEYLVKENIIAPKTDKDNRVISNIVYMGMGEPLDNYKNIKKSVTILSDDRALGIGKRKITISTSGIMDKLDDLHKDTGVRIAISLNATNDELRSKIMPVNKKWNITDIVKSIKKLNLKKHEFITIEYVMFGGLNDSLENAKELSNLLKGLPVKINLIPYNSFEDSEFKATTDRKIHDFYDVLVKNGLVCNVRYSKGQDISAACGQLRSEDKD